MAIEGLRPMLPDEVSIPQEGFLCRLTLSTVCLADTDSYGLLELSSGTFTALMPVSSIPSGTPQRPCIAVVIPGQEGDEEGDAAFLMATHNAESGTLGMFMNENGEPCRGTMEWESNTIAVTVDAQYVVSLLKNSTLQIHRLSNQRLSQTLPIAADVKPRSIAHTYTPLYIPTPQSQNTPRPSSTVGSPKSPPTPPLSPPPSAMSAMYPSRPPSSTSSSRRPMIEEPLRPVRFLLSPMIPRSSPGPRSQTSSPLPSRSRRRGHQRPLSVASASSLTTTFTLGGVAKLGGGGMAKTFVIGKDTVWAVWRMGLVGRVEEMMGTGKMDEAVELLEREGDDSPEEATEKSFLYQRALWFYLLQTEFVKASKLLMKSKVDPRLIIRLFPDMVGGLLQNGEETDVYAGIVPVIAETGSIEDIVVGNLQKNYAPHIKPDVESAPATSELKGALMTNAANMLSGYLQQWRSRRRRKDARIVEGYTQEQLKSIDELVDTTLAKLYIDGKLDEDLHQLLRTSNDCILSELDTFLKDWGRYNLLSDIYLREGEIAKVLELWTRLLDGVWRDPEFDKQPEDVCALTLSTDDSSLIWKYAFWLMDKDEQLCLNVFQDTNKMALFKTRDIYNEMKARNASVASKFLEFQIFQPDHHDPELHNALLDQYLTVLHKFLQEDSITQLNKALAAQYTIEASSPPSTFSAFLLREASKPRSAEGSSSSSTIESYLNVRLKFLLLLSQSSDYDVNKVRSELEQEIFSSLLVERSIVYGKLSMDPQALRLLISHPLRDVVSAETYCIQLGDPILHQDAAATAKHLSLPVPHTRKGKTGLKADAKRNFMLKNLVKIMLDDQDQEGDGEKEGLSEGMIGIVDRQGVRLDTLEV
ncbi:hypothetical protein BT69DRAFT_1285168, partial [Atractiella rhizophila]